MGLYNADLSADWQSVLDDLGEEITLTHKTGQTLNTTTGAFVEVNESQTIDAVLSELVKSDFELNPSKFGRGGRVFRLRDADLTVSAIAIDDEIIYDGDTFRIVDARKHREPAIWRLAAERVEQ